MSDWLLRHCQLLLLLNYWRSWPYMGNYSNKTKFSIGENPRLGKCTVIPKPSDLREMWQLTSFIKGELWPILATLYLKSGKKNSRLPWLLACNSGRQGRWRWKPPCTLDRTSRAGPEWLWLCSGCVQTHPHTWTGGWAAGLSRSHRCAPLLGSHTLLFNKKLQLNKITNKLWHNKTFA